MLASFALDAEPNPWQSAMQKKRHGWETVPTFLSIFLKKLITEVVIFGCRFRGSSAGLQLKRKSTI